MARKSGHHPAQSIRLSRGMQRTRGAATATSRAAALDDATAARRCRAQTPSQPRSRRQCPCRPRCWNYPDCSDTLVGWNCEDEL